MATCFKSAVHCLALCTALGVIEAMECRAQAIAVNGGNQTITITTAVAGAEPTSVMNTSCTLSYQKQSVLSKISVSTSCPGQRFGLNVLATSVTNGTAAPSVTLSNGNPATDLITSIPKTGPKTGTCTLQFRASATFAQGNSTDLGPDVHNITYTILAQ